MCGEQWMPCSPRGMIKGSPPRVRGTVWAGIALRAFYRITPACAGNRQAVENPSQGDQDHPRVCGEQTPARSPVCGIPGSPPRVRGTDWPPKKVAASRRITPACAGNSCCGVLGGIIWKDHPRVCGEQGIFISSLKSRTGSPPRVRGTERRRRRTGWRNRITPACAGNRAFHTSAAGIS